MLGIGVYRLGFLGRRGNVDFCSAEEGVQGFGFLNRRGGVGGICLSKVSSYSDQLVVGDWVLQVQGIGEGEVMSRGRREGLDGGEDGRCCG